MSFRNTGHGVVAPNWLLTGARAEVYEAVCVTEAQHTHTHIYTHDQRLLNYQSSGLCTAKEKTSVKDRDLNIKLSVPGKGRLFLPYTRHGEKGRKRGGESMINSI